MRQDDKTNKNSAKERKFKYMRDWRNEHGEPDFDYLHSLVMDGTQEALEKLRSIAESLDVNYDPNATAEELIERIGLATSSDSDITS